VVLAVASSLSGRYTTTRARRNRATRRCSRVVLARRGIEARPGGGGNVVLGEGRRTSGRADSRGWRPGPWRAAVIAIESEPAPVVDNGSREGLRPSGDRTVRVYPRGGGACWPLNQKVAPDPGRSRPDLDQSGPPILAPPRGPMAVALDLVRGSSVWKRLTDPLVESRRDSDRRGPST